MHGILINDSFCDSPYYFDLVPGIVILFSLLLVRMLVALSSVLYSVLVVIIVLPFMACSLLTYILSCLPYEGSMYTCSIFSIMYITTFSRCVVR